LVGVVLALVLTAIPFGLVAARALRPIQIFVVIAVAAITQVVVHLRYFIHLDFKPSSIMLAWLRTTDTSLRD
jgi:cytochrome o ubiquinol oxidase subunit IV